MLSDSHDSLPRLRAGDFVAPFAVQILLDTATLEATLVDL